METIRQPRFTKRYELVTEEKAGGATYTPKLLADFVAKEIINIAAFKNRPLRILDPAVGHGELLLSLLEQLPEHALRGVQVYGFETDHEALSAAKDRLEKAFPEATLHFQLDSFLDIVVEQFGGQTHGTLFSDPLPNTYDLIIANPPYVRTQIIGAKQARLLAEQFSLAGRVDLYYAFILGMSQVLRPHGVAGIIVSNRFMTTKSGASVRRALFDRFNIRQAWDLGDTKLFEAAVLPAVLLVEGKNGEEQKTPTFTSIYQSKELAAETASDPIEALEKNGVVELPDGRRFHVQHGKLANGNERDGVWRIATASVDSWLANVEAHTWGTFRNIGKIRVGVKTCADKIFIRRDWSDLPAEDRPELLRPLITHHVARRFKPAIAENVAEILYPHEVVQGRRRAVDLTQYPASAKYLESYRSSLMDRKYVIEAGREWYEIWVPQDPEAWDAPKLVFRDISEEPTFWLDLDGSVVNGDCYWLICQKTHETDLLWLAAAVGNSTFIERFYDLSFNNKLYAGRRRFITQYVEKFPLPDPGSEIGQSIIATAKQAFDTTPSPEADALRVKLDRLVWMALTGAEAPC